MRRREFIKLIAGSTVAWPLAVRAQHSALPVIGFLSSASSDLYSNRLRTFRQGLKEENYVEGQNVKIEYRWAAVYLTSQPLLSGALRAKALYRLIGTLLGAVAMLVIVR
jgi:putative ABC transport system substrate-binding protein